MASDSVQVVIRVRPLITREKIDGAKALWQTQNDMIYQKDGSHRYRFDKVFSQDHNTYDVYDHVVPIVKACMDGFNGTVFAYGQTASGKTYTMTGDVDNPGIIPLTVEEVYNTIENMPDREFLIRFSFMEIYNENVVDLLGDLRKYLEVREDIKSNIFVDGLTEEIVTNPDQVMNLLSSGENKRHYGSTSMNERSSRSHTIFKLIIESRLRLDNTRASIEQTDDAVKVSTLNLVDLAGSEKAKHTGATGQRLAEGGFINKSLLHLSSVISQLSENASFISYRDSKLTRILQNSLGGNSKTAIICNVTPAAIEETLSTLRFATSAKRIKNKPKVNEVLSDDAMLKRCKKEIAALKKTLKEMKQLDVGVVQEEKMELELKLEEEKKFRQEQESKITRLTELICVSSRSTGQTPKVENKRKRRETWCPGKARKCATADLISQANQAWALPSFSAVKPPVTSIHRRSHCLQDKNLSFSMMTSAVQEVRDEEADQFHDQSSSFDRLHKNMNLDDSCFVKPGPQVCDGSCQTEDVSYEVAANEDNVDLLLQMEAFKLDLESRDTQITELSQQLVDKEEELTSLNTAMDKQLENETKLNTEIYRLQVQLREKETCKSPAPEQQVSMEAVTELTNRIEILEAEKLELQKNVSEACNISQSTMIDLEATNKSLEEMRNKYRLLEIEYQDLQEELQLKHQELEELGEFNALEEDYRNMSILEKKEARRRLSSQILMSPERASDSDLTRLHKKVAELEKDRTDAESLCRHTKKELAQAQDETKLVEQEFRSLKDTVVKLEKQIERLENEKKDFDLVMEMEVSKYKRRESELTEQLSSAYGELGSSGKQPSDQTSEMKQLQETIENLQSEIKRLEEVNLKISGESQHFKDKIKETEELQENLDKALKKAEILQSECSELRVTKEELENHIQSLKQELQSHRLSTCELEDLRTKNESLEMEIQGLKEQLEIQSDNIKSLPNSQEQDSVFDVASQKEQEDLINSLRSELQALKASQGVCCQCGLKPNTSCTNLNQTVDCSFVDHQMRLLSAKPTKSGSSQKMSVFDEMQDLTVGLSGLFPQRALQDTTTSDSDLNPEVTAAMKELQEDLEFQLKQCKEEISRMREREAEMAGVKERLEKERDALIERVEGLVREIEGLRTEVTHMRDMKEGVFEAASEEEKDMREKEGEELELDQKESGEAVEMKQVEEACAEVKRNDEKVWDSQSIKLQEECEALRKELIEVQGEKEALRQRVEELQHSVAGLQEKLQSQSDRDSETDFNKKIVEIRDLAMEKLEEAKAMYKQEQDKCINQLAVKHKKEISELEEEHKVQLESLQQGHEKIIEELRQEHQQDMTKAGDKGKNNALAEQIIDKLKREINTLQEELSVAENVMVMKESELEALEQKYTDTVQRLKDERHQAQSEMVQGHKEAIEHLKNKHREENEEMTEQLNSLCEKYNELLDTQDMQGQEKLEIERLEERVKTLQTDRQELVLKIEDLEVKVKEITKSKTDVELKYEHDTQMLTGEMKVLREEKEAQLEICNGQISDLESQLTEIKQGVNTVTASLEEKREELEVSLQEKQKELTEKDKLISEGRVTLKKLTGELESAKESITEGEASYKNKLGELESEKSRLKLENEKYMDEIEQLKSKVSDTYSVSEEVDRLKQNLQEVRAEREELCSEQKSSIEKIDKLTALVTELEGTLEEEKQAHNETQEKVEVMESTISKGYAMIQQFEQDAAELQEESDKMREEKEQLEQKYEELMDKYDSHLEEVRSDHEADIQTYVDRNAELQAKYEEVCGEYEQIRAEVEKANQEQTDQYLSQIASLEQEMEELRSNHAEEEVRLKQQLLEQQQMLEGKLRDMELDHSALERKIQALEIQRENDLMEQEWKLQKDIQEKSEALDCVQKERDQLKEQVEECKQAGNQLKTEVTKAQEALKRKEEELSAVRVELKESEEWHQEEEERLKRFIDEADDELDQCRRDLTRTEIEFEEYKKKHLKETSMSFSNAEEKYQKQLERLKWQYEQEIARLRRVGTETRSDLDTSVCQLKEEKSRMSALQEAVLKKEKENDALRASVQKANEKVQELQSELKEAEEAAEEEAEHLKSCVDSAEDDLDKKTSECYQLKDEIEKLKKVLGSQAAAEKLAKVEKEKDELLRQVGQKKMELVMMNNQMMKIADPLKREIKYLKGDNAYMREQMQRLKNEVRRLKNNQQDDSVVCESRPQPTQPASSGVMQEVLRFSLESDKKVLENEVERLKKSNDNCKETVAQLKQQLAEKDHKLANYKSYYKKQLTQEEKTTLRDIVNSPRPEAGKSRTSRASSSKAGGENEAPSENWLSTSWLSRDSKPSTSTEQEEAADGCKQQ